MSSLRLFIIVLCVWFKASGVSATYAELKSSRDKAMVCPPDGSDSTGMVIALSPKRYAQLIAVTKDENQESACGPRSQMPFDLNYPESWGFCAVGMCFNDDLCLCYQGYAGRKCETFNGYCWLMYCHLVGCNSPDTYLSCSCNSQAYGMGVSTNEFWYDDGLNPNYFPPPDGYPPETVAESKILFHSISKNRYDVDGADKNKYTSNQAENYGGNGGQSGFNGNPAQSGFNGNPDQSGFNGNPAQSGFNGNPAQSGFNRNPAQTGFNRNPAQSDLNGKPAQSNRPNANELKDKSQSEDTDTDELPAEFDENGDEEESAEKEETEASELSRADKAFTKRIHIRVCSIVLLIMYNVLHI